jgi:hypothetical protein
MLPDEGSALVVASAFLIASFSIVIVIYRLQWDHFDKKNLAAKHKAKDGTLSAFVREAVYLAVAAIAILVNVRALLGQSAVIFALVLTLIAGLFFFAIIGWEFWTSIRHLWREIYATQDP